MFERLHNKKKLAAIFGVALTCTTAFVLLHHYSSYASQVTIDSPFVFGQDASRIQHTGLFGPTESAKHPIEILVEEANKKFKIMQQQSSTFKQALTEYKRRYHREPPPGFRHWYDAAVKSNATVIDNFDTIMAGLEPFWGITAREMRARVQDLQAAQEFKLVSISIKDQKFSVSNAQDVTGPYKYRAYMDWVQPYLEFIPDMEMAFSLIDEARVVVSRDELDKAMKRCPGRPRNDDSNRVEQRLPIYFENLSGQKSWMTTTRSCSVDSPSRSGIIPPQDDGVYFIRNVTLAKDSCEHPSAMIINSGFGPKTTVRLIETLHPIFSRSKLSTYQDILLPAADYAPNDRYKSFDASQDMPWDNKSNTFYWAGATTGAEARKDNGWRKWQRERFVTNMNDNNRTISLLKKNGRRGRWEVYEDEMDSLSHMIDVSFTNTIHCDRETCDVMREELPFRKERQPAGAVYGHRFVMDIDGNAFTERFYRLLMSKSTVFKMTMYQEWHDDRLIPWVHYVPISLEMTELPETLRFLSKTERGQEIAKNIAEQGSEWALKVLRHEDLGLAVFRTLLEYGRLYGEERDRKGESPWNREHG